jgi:hypothetical protein
LHLFGLGITFRESKGKQKQRPAHPEWLLPKLLTKDICEAVSQLGGMWKWAPAESPSKMIPLGCEPRQHNLFTLFMHRSRGEAPDWVAMRADRLVHCNSDALHFSCVGGCEGHSIQGLNEISRPLELLAKLYGCRCASWISRKPTAVRHPE